MEECRWSWTHWFRIDWWWKAKTM
jgi:hypothetical protein